MTRKFIDIRRINIDGSTQTRAAMQPRLVEEYADVLREADEYPFPPVKLFWDGETHWIGDGFHRVLAARAAGYPQVFADVAAGTRRDAMLYAVGANHDHGARRSTEDKRRAVQILLADPEWSGKSNRWIAEACRVSHPFVSQLRPPAADQVEGRDGKTYSRVEQANQAASAETPAAEPATAQVVTLPREGDVTSDNSPPDAATSHASDDQPDDAAWHAMREQQLAARSAIMHTAGIITQLAELEPEGRHLLQVADRIKQHLQHAANTLYQTAPAAACPKCDAGESCRYCLGTGFVTTRQERKK